MQTHTHSRTQTHITRTHANTLLLALSLSPSPKTRVWSEGRSSLSFYDKCSPILYARGSGHRGCASQLYYNHFKAIVFLLPKLFIIHLLTHVFTHTHTYSTHSRAPRKRRRKEWKSTRRWMTVDNKIHNGREYGERGKFAKTETGQRKRTVASIQNYHLG